MQPEVRSFDIGGHLVGRGAPLFVMAEIGLNHGGSVDRALALVDAAADAGADAVKFQTLVARDLVAPGCPAPAHVVADSLADFFSTFELDEAAHTRLAARARRRGLKVVATPFSLDAVAMLERVGVDAYKIASGDLTWDQLIGRCAATGKPLIVSTGLALLERSTTRCPSPDPAPPAPSRCSTVCPRIRCPRAAKTCGRSRRWRGRSACPRDCPTMPAMRYAVPMAVALGASIYERHLVLDADSDAIDRAVFGKHPVGVGRAIVAARAARKPRSVTAARNACRPKPPTGYREPPRCARPENLPAGHVLSAKDLIALRPGAGIPPGQLPGLIGLRLLRPLVRGAAFEYNDLQVTDGRRHRAS